MIITINLNYDKMENYNVYIDDRECESAYCKVWNKARGILCHGI